VGRQRGNAEGQTGDRNHQLFCSKVHKFMMYEALERCKSLWEKTARRGSPYLRNTKCSGYFPLEYVTILVRLIFAVGKQYPALQRDLPALSAKLSAIST
jgi:hypothetical protein